MWPVPVGDDVLRWQVRAARTLLASHGVTFDVVQVEPPPGASAAAGVAGVAVRPEDGAAETAAVPAVPAASVASAGAEAEVDTVGDGVVERALVRVPRVALGVVLDEQERVLLRWRHRFVADTFGWELPTGDVEPDEDAAATAVRAVVTDTGWRPASPLTHLVTSYPSGGRVDQPHEVFLAEGAEYVGLVDDPPPPVQWIMLATVPDLVQRGQITDAGSLVGLLYTLALRAKRA